MEEKSDYLYDLFIEEAKPALDRHSGGGSTEIELPKLSSPASSEVIAEGYDAIDQDGNVIVGSLPIWMDEKHLAPEYEAYLLKPSTEPQVLFEKPVIVPAPAYIAGDENLVPENIKSGVSIFGVEGELEAGESESPSAGNNEDDSLLRNILSSEDVVEELVIPSGVRRLRSNMIGIIQPTRSLVLPDSLECISYGALSNISMEPDSTLEIPYGASMIEGGSIVSLNQMPKIIIYASVGTCIDDPFMDLTEEAHGYIPELRIKGIPSGISPNAFGNELGSFVEELYVSWSEGEVADAPWGYRGIIHYNSEIPDPTYHEYYIKNTDIGEIVPEMDRETFDTLCDHDYYPHTKLIEGGIYLVTIDGVTYECVCNSATVEGEYGQMGKQISVTVEYIGNLCRVDEFIDHQGSIEDTSEPFIIMNVLPELAYYERKYGGVYMPFDGETIKVERIQ